MATSSVAPRMHTPETETAPKPLPKIMVVVEPVCVQRETAAAMLGVSLAHWERHVQPHVRLVRSGNLRLVPVDEIKVWVKRVAHAPVVRDGG